MGVFFLVDFENVNSDGLKGVELLRRQDNLTIFYSQHCKTIERSVFQGIVESECAFDIQKLDKPGKNGLDFLITAHIHMLFNSGEEDPVVVISRGRGYDAVRRYWLARERRVYIRPNLCAGIIAANEMNERCRLAHDRVAKVDIEQEFLLLKRRAYERECLSGILGGDSEKVDSLFAWLAQSSTPRERYLHLLKTYGRAMGTQLYRQIKALGISLAG